VTQPTEDAISEYRREQEELEYLRKKRRHRMSLDEAQEAAPDAVWTPKLSQDNAGDMARREIDQKARAKQAEEEAKAEAKRAEEAARERDKREREEVADAKRKQEKAEAARIYELQHRQSRLRESVATTIVGRAAVFLICVIVGVALFVLLFVLDGFSSMTSTEAILFVLLVCTAIINVVLGMMWCTNTGWGEGRQVLCCCPCVCDEADADRSDSEDDDDANMP
jgi:uncharacterized protein YhaN